MKIHFEHNGTTLEYERRPMPEHRIKALCLLAAGGLYVGLAVGIAKLCGIWGILVLAGATVLAILAANEF